MMKIKNIIKWFFATNYGRYLLGAIFLASGVFSREYGTIDFLATDYVVFEYTPAICLGIWVLQIIYHVAVAIVSNLKNNSRCI